MLYASNGQVDYSDHFVAFIDILGYKEKILSIPDDQATQFIERMQKLWELIAESRRNRPASSWQEYRGMSLKFYTDCLTISAEVRPHSLSIMAEEVAILQNALYQDGLLTRGGIALGKHFQSDHMVFSKAHLKAYYLEQAAIYPRVILEDGLLAHASIIDYFILAPDGKVFIDYLAVIHDLELEGEDLKKEFVRQKDRIVEGIQRYSSSLNPKILCKYQWLAAYHNWTVQNYTGYACPKEELQACATIPGIPGQNGYKKGFDILRALEPGSPSGSPFAQRSRNHDS